MNREMLTEAELKKTTMIQSIEKSAKQESSKMFVMEKCKAKKKRKLLPKHAVSNDIKEILSNPVKNEPECLSQYPSICFGDAFIDLATFLGMRDTQFNGIFSGTQTPLDPFCSIEGSERDREPREDLDDFNGLDDGNIFDLIIAEDGMIRNRSYSQLNL